MNKLQSVLQAIDAKLNEVRPSTMDELINVVHSVPGSGDYGSHYYIVKYMGYLQGVRVAIFGRSKEHLLPSPTKVYSVFKGIEEFEKAGWPVIND